MALAAQKMRKERKTAAMISMKNLLALAALLVAIPQVAQADILVGFVTGLSGPVSSIGIPNAKGIAAGEAYVGEIAGEKLRVIQLDDGSDPTASARNARKLVEQEKVDILIGTSGAPQTLAMATAAIEMKIPMIAVSPIAPVPLGDGGPWVVQTPQPTPLLVQGIVDHMKARGVKTVAFIGFSDAFGDLMYDSLAQSAKAADIKVIANERYARSDSSVTAQVLRALAARPDAIMLGGTGTPGALPVIALSERGYKGPLYGNHGLISADFLRLAGKAANGIICPTGPVTAAEQLPPGNPIRKVALDFRAAFEKANGEPATDSFSSYSFDGWLVLADAAKRAMATGAKPGSPEFRNALRQALFATKEVVGTQAVYTFTAADRHGVDDRSRILVQIEDGKYKLLP
jgi:branched-chain amino acid transport system substrate-binding protein